MTLRAYQAITSQEKSLLEIHVIVLVKNDKASSLFKQQKVGIVYALGKPIDLRVKGIDQTLSILWDRNSYRNPSKMH